LYELTVAFLKNKNLEHISRFNIYEDQNVPESTGCYTKSTAFLISATIFDDIING